MSGAVGQGVEGALAAVREVADRISEAEIDRITAVSAARDAGATVTAIADAAKLSRPAIYRILSSNPRTLPPKSLWRDTMGDGLILLMSYGSDYAAGAVGKVHSLGVDVLARRLLYGVRQLGAAPAYDSGDAERISVAIDVAQEVLNRQKRGDSLADL